MSRFGSTPLSFFETVYQGIAPWDIGGPQPAMVNLLKEFPPEGPVLDVGCGSGDLAIHIAERGVETLGIDFVEEAISKACSKKDALPSDVATRLDFLVADALHASRLGRTFHAVVDSGFYHLFDPEQSAELVDELALVLRPGGRCYLHEFAVTFPVPNVPRQVCEDEIRGRFTTAKGWRILTIQTGEFLSRIAPVPATLACIEYLGRGDG